jgi:hypothetical protein
MLSCPTSPSNLLLTTGEPNSETKVDNKQVSLRFVEDKICFFDIGVANELLVKPIDTTDQLQCEFLRSAGLKLEDWSIAGHYKCRYARGPFDDLEQGNDVV